MYEQSAHIVYDALNTARGKDYISESAEIADAVRARSTGAHTLLDVGCGTGRHLDEFRGLGFACTGVDVSEQMLAVASQRLSDVPLHVGDLRTLDLGRKYDVVVCLNGTLAYMTAPGDLRIAVSNLAQHLAVGGVVILEPWFAPDQWYASLVGAESATNNGVAVARVSRTSRTEQIGRFEWLCSVATPETTYSSPKFMNSGCTRSMTTPTHAPRAASWLIRFRLRVAEASGFSSERTFDAPALLGKTLATRRSVRVQHKMTRRYRVTEMCGPRTRSRTTRMTSFVSMTTSEACTADPTPGQRAGHRHSVGRMIDARHMVPNG
jgi:SAM-dependent methyltransferase